MSSDSIVSKGIANLETRIYRLSNYQYLLWITVTLHRPIRYLVYWIKMSHNVEDSSVNDIEHHLNNWYPQEVLRRTNWLCRVDAL